MAPVDDPTNPDQDLAIVPSDDKRPNRAVVISLSTVLSVAGTGIILTLVFLFLRHRHRRRALFNRGISPIDDEEIASWKISREEKESVVAEGTAGAVLSDANGTVAVNAANVANATNVANAANATDKQMQTPTVNAAVATTATTATATTSRKPASVIVYANRPSEEMAANSSSWSTAAVASQGPKGPHSIHSKRSIDLPQTPVLARAPNARPGLTDESVAGDDAFIAASSPRRQASRLTKPPQRSPRHHVRSRSSRSSMGGSIGEARKSASIGSLGQWYGYGQAYAGSSPAISGSSFRTRSQSFGGGGRLAGTSYYGIVDTGITAPHELPPRSSVDNFLYSKKNRLPEGSGNNRLPEGLGNPGDDDGSGSRHPERGNNGHTVPAPVPVPASASGTRHHRRVWSAVMARSSSDDDCTGGAGVAMGEISQRALLRGEIGRAIG